MNYILITPNGRVVPFYLLSVAQTYLMAYGGTLIDTTVVFAQQTENIS
jgi:hypothetical protein